MSADKHHIDILRYLRGEMSQAEAHVFERKALDDPFLADALEGAELIGVDQFEKDLITVNNSFNKSKRTPFSFLKIAAVIALLILGGFSIWYITEDLKTSDVVYSEPETEDFETDELVGPPKPEVEVEPESAQNKEKSVKNDEKAEAKKIEEFDNSDGIARSDDRIAASAMEEEELDEFLADEDVADSFVETESQNFDEEMPAEADRAASKAPTKTALRKEKRSKLNATGAVSRLTSSEKPTREVNGLVTDDFGDPLPGVNVLIQGTNTGVTSDMDGEFSIDQVNDSTRLVFSSVGMKTQEIVIGRRDSMTVKLIPDAQSLQEVIVTGYGAFDNEPEGYHGTSPVIGYPEFKNYLEQELVYPQEARDKGIEGRVVLKVTISPIGKIDSVEVKRGLGHGCDEEALRLIMEGPAWSPATQDGLNVEASVRIRVKFELE